MNSSLLIATLFTTFVLFATLASAAKEKERRLLKGSAGATTNWAKKQHNNRHLKKTPHAAVCGNNNVEAGEECDGTDVTNCATDEYCNDCTCSPRCGNGIFDTGEECEDDNDCTANAGDFCHTDCTCKTPGCGNGVKEGSEECDDRNNVDGDGCSSTCTIEAGCGDGIKEGIEECDGNTGCVEGKYCTDTCTCEPVTLAEMSIFGLWHCGNHYCDWSQPRSGFNLGASTGSPNLSNEFDYANRWMIDRDMDGSYRPSVNLVVLSFVQPERLYWGLSSTDFNFDPNFDNAYVQGLPKGMTPEVVTYFKERGVKVMVSMGGATYTDEYDRIFNLDVNDPNHTAAKKLGAKMWEVVEALGLDGWEVDYESGTPDPIHLSGVEAMMNEYRVWDKYNTIMTMDLAVGNRYLTELSRRASARDGTGWLETGLLDYINAMVPGQEPQESQWQEHIDGMPNYNPPVDGKKPCQFTVSLWLIKGKQAEENCDDFDASEMKSHAPYVSNVPPANNYGATNGLLGYMFWAAESTSPRRITTTPSGQTCEYGMGVGATTFGPPIPLDFTKLRQD